MENYMIFDVLLHQPHLWTFAAALCFGGMLSSLTRRVSRSRDPDKARERKGFATVLAGVLSVIFMLCAVFIPGPEKILDVTILLLFLIVTTVSFLAFRFRKAAGIPIFFLSCGLILAVLLFFQAVTAFTGETEVARLHVTSADGNNMGFYLVTGSGMVKQLQMPGTLLGVEMKEIIFDDFFVFFGVKTAYRFLGIKSATVRPGSEMTQELRIYELPRPIGLSEAVYHFVEDHPGLIPGIKTAQMQITYVKVKPDSVYSIRVQHDSGTEIMSMRVTSH
jgi:hypothetical protein